MRVSGFGTLSDSDEELSAAVDDIISQAKDLCALEQVARINCSGFADSDLPNELEARFRKLKSFPVSKPRNPVDLENSKSLGEGKGGSFTVGEKYPDGKLGLVEELRGGSLKGDGLTKGNEEGDSVSSRSGSSGFLAGHQVASSSPTTRKEGSSDPLGSEKLFMDSPSPPRKGGCFWFSPKKALKRASVGSRSFDMGKKSEDFSGSDSGSFSIKDHEKIMRKMRKEEEKIAKEAEKIVEWAKQASARMSFHGVVDDELSD